MEDYFDFKKVNCPVCKSKKFEFVGYRGGEAHQASLGKKTRIVRCLSCTHKYPNPMPFPKVSLGTLYNNSTEYFRNHDLELKKTAALNLIKRFKKRLIKKPNFLDIGCGRGEMVWAASQQGWNAEGIDPSNEFIEFGVENLGANIRKGILEEQKYPAASFDAVTLGGVVEHLYDPGKMFDEIHRILKPNGWLWFDAPNESGLYMQLGDLYMKLQKRDWTVTLAPTFPPFHVQGFNPRSIKILMDQRGFKIRKLAVFGGVCEQTGEISLRKKIEHKAASLVNFIGKKFNKGTYMDIWVQKA